MRRPLAIDLFCGLGGWAEGFIAEGYRVVGFDNERHDYGTGGYPGQLVIQDVVTLHGSQFKNATVIVASPPCQKYSYMAMPWSRAKAQIKQYEESAEKREELNALFNACFRIQREACEAAGRHIPMVVENVRGAQRWVGRSVWNFGSYHLWGDVPALMPIAKQFKTSGMNWSDRTKRGQDFTRIAGKQAEEGAKTPAGNCKPAMWKDREIARYAHPTPEEFEKHGFKVPGFRFDGSGKSFEHIKGMSGLHGMSHPGGKGKRDLGGPNDPRRFSSKSSARKAASAMIAKIPEPLARHIARVFKGDV